ncbi:MAG: hypothetical protein ACUZ8E_13685 [Candidatus Anammoxibacter sp.]
MSQKKVKRRKYIVDHDFQYGLIRKMAMLSLSIFLGSVGVFVLIYCISDQFQGEVIAQPDPFSLYVDITLMDSPKIASLLAQIWPYILASTFVVTIVTFIFGVVISHRMAGPVFRMRKVLSNMADGDVSGNEERFRGKDDYIKPLFKDIQSVKLRWQKSIGEMQQICDKLDDQNQQQFVDKFQKFIFSFKVDKV